MNVEVGNYYTYKYSGHTVIVIHVCNISRTVHYMYSAPPLETKYVDLNSFRDIFLPLNKVQY